MSAAMVHCRTFRIGHSGGVVGVDDLIASTVLTLELCCDYVEEQLKILLSLGRWLGIRVYDCLSVRHCVHCRLSSIQRVHLSTSGPHGSLI